MRIPIILLIVVGLSKICFCQTNRSLDTTSFYAWPNPFSNTINFDFTLTDKDTVSLNIYNIYGQNVGELLTDSILLQGSYSIQHTLQDSIEGSYIVQLLINGESFVKRIVRVLSNNINNINETALLKVFPNPIQDYLYVENPNNKAIIITIFDMTGKQLYQFDNKGKLKRIDFTRNPKGLYFMTINTEKQTISKIVIKD